MINTIKHPLLFLVLYLELSISEWIFHKYVMHNNENSISRRVYGTEHIAHHLEVENDMKLVEDSNGEGLEMLSCHTIAESIYVFMIFSLTIRHIFKINLKLQYIALISISIAVFYKVAWNFLHTSFHQLTDIQKYINNPIYYLLFKNHACHHLQKGKRKGNYNIILLGADYLFGTYKTCIDHTYMSQDEIKKHVKTHDLYKMQINNKPLPFGLKFYPVQQSHENDD